MRWVGILLAAGLSGCQMYSEMPTGRLMARGDYKAIAECFYLKVRGEGFWDLKHFESMNMSEAVMGNEFARGGAVTFKDMGEQTDVVFQIAHSARYARVVQECESFAGA